MNVRTSTLIGVGLLFALWALPSFGVVFPPPAAGAFNPNHAPIPFQAPGSNLDLATVEASFPSLYAADVAGVLNGDVGAQFYTFGQHNAKTLRFYNAAKDTGVPVGSTQGQAMAAPSDPGIFGFNGPDTTITLTVGPVTGGTPGEAVTALGLIVVGLTQSGSPVDEGIVTFTAGLSNGGSVTASRHVSEGSGLGNTFYGFQAPAGASITSLTYSDPSHPSFPNVWFDDIVFITPEPAGLVTLGLIALPIALTRRRRRRDNNDGRSEE